MHDLHGCVRQVPMNDGITCLAHIHCMHVVPAMAHHAAAVLALHVLVLRASPHPDAGALPGACQDVRTQTTPTSYLPLIEHPSPNPLPWLPTAVKQAMPASHCSASS